MSKRYVIHAMEQSYCGLHGIESWLVEVLNSFDEAVEYAVETSYEVMDSYGFIEEYLEEQAKEWAEEEDCELYSDEYYEQLDWIRNDNINYHIYEVLPDCPMTCEEIERELANDPESFVEDWCIEPDEDF